MRIRRPVTSLATFVLLFGICVLTPLIGLGAETSFATPLPNQADRSNPPHSITFSAIIDGHTIRLDTKHNHVTIALGFGESITISSSEKSIGIYSLAGAKGTGARIAASGSCFDPRISMNWSIFGITWGYYSIADFYCTTSPPLATCPSCTITSFSSPPAYTAGTNAGVSLSHSESAFWLSKPHSAEAIGNWHFTLSTPWFPVTSGEGQLYIQMFGDGGAATWCSGC